MVCHARVRQSLIRRQQVITHSTPSDTTGPVSARPAPSEYTLLMRAAGVDRGIDAPHAAREN